MSATASTGSMGSGSTTPTTTSTSAQQPPCPKCGAHVQAALSKIEMARRKLQLRQESLVTDQALLKADKRNFKRRLQAAKMAAANQAVASERIQDESVKLQQQVSEKAVKHELLEQQQAENARKLEEQLQEIESLKLQLKQSTISTTTVESKSAETLESSSSTTNEQTSMIADLKQQLQDKEMALESYEMQMLELERDRDDLHNSQSSNKGFMDDDDDNKDHDCPNCRYTQQGLMRAQQECKQAHAQRNAETAQLSLQVTDLQESLLALKINQVVPISSQAVESATTAVAVDEEELEALRRQLSELQTEAETRNQTLTEQAQKLNELEATNNALQSANDPSSTTTTAPPPDNNSSGDASSREPDKSTHTHVMEREWHGPEFAGIYTGWLLSSSSNNPDCTGTLRVDDGAVYDGDWKNGARHGQGVWATIDGDIYRGAWVQGSYQGFGVHVWSDGRLYRGTWAAGKRHGTGVMTWPYGAHYTGEWQNDKRNGNGVYYYADGRCYTGEYRDDRPHGNGQLRASADNAMIYDGAWEFGEYLGKEASK